MAMVNTQTGATQMKKQIVGAALVVSMLMVPSAMAAQRTCHTVDVYDGAGGAWQTGYVFASIDETLRYIRMHAKAGTYVEVSFGIDCRGTRSPAK